MIPAFKIGFRIKVALWFVTVLVFVALISGLIYAVAGLVFKGRNDDGLITYSYGEKGSRMSEYQVSSSEYVESGKAFIDFSRIASDCGFTVSADEGEIKYIIDNGSNDSVKFYYGSRFAFVNGFAVFLSELKDQLFFLFLGGVILTFFLSVMTGLILEKIFHRKWCN